MTGIRTMLAVLADPTSGAAVLETAMAVARDQSCHVEALHVRPDPAQSVPLVGEAMSGAMVDEMMEVAEREGRDTATRVRALFDDFCGRYAIPTDVEPPGPPEVSASYKELVGVEDTLVACRGRVADLVVAARPGSDDGSALITLNAALMESGRPVLAAPAETPATVGRRVAIAWNGSAEAARAVSVAMPILTRAEAVVALIADDTEAERGIGAADLETHLAWHEVALETRRILPTGAGAGPALLKGAQDARADLLVMGAYTHSRLRQLILGGVTRHILANAPIPVLLSH